MTLNELRAWAADNFVAATHQTMGQYRTALLRAIDQVIAAASLPAGDGLTDSDIQNLAHRMCSKYMHAESEDFRQYGFGKLTLIQFARAILAAGDKK